jgi:hypothetical protein
MAKGLFHCAELTQLAVYSKHFSAKFPTLRMLFRAVKQHVIGLATIFGSRQIITDLSSFVKLLIVRRNPFW